MPRPLSWLPRLHEIRNTIANSVRSHYSRQDLQRIFELQPRAAQKLLELLPSAVVGTSRLVEREVLAGFLERVRDTDDTTVLFEQIRGEKAGGSPKKLRTLIRRDREAVSLSALPASMRLSRGRLEVSFATVQQLAEAMYTLARILESEGDEFALAYEPEPTSIQSNDREEVKKLFEDLQEVESCSRRRK